MLQDRWLKMPLGTKVGLGPDHIVLDGNPATPHKKAYSGPNFRPMSIVAKRSSSQLLLSSCCTAHGRVSLGMLRHDFPPIKIALSHGAIWTPSNTWFLRPTESTTLRFAQVNTEHPNALQWAALSPKNCPFP